MSVSWPLSWSPVNSFPDYHGPYQVGTVDVEIPSSDLPEPCATPEGAQPTIAFRIFYPCVKPLPGDTNRPVRWIPQPQRPTLTALLKFLGVKAKTAGLTTFLTQHLYYINLRAHRNAELLEPPTSNGRWPITFFSHGLAGSRNAYSYICGDLASNGTIVIAMDHRDGSSPIQYVRPTMASEAHVVDTIKIGHEARKEVFDTRDRQLRIRIWEIAMAFEALMKIDAGQELQNLDRNTSRNHRERVEVLLQFEGKTDIHREGKVSWAGHSFGAATIAQLVKSLLYSRERTEEDGMPLITPTPDAAILHQINAESPVLLLDLWGLPLQSPDQAYLWNKPLGENVLSVLSEGFYNWNDNFKINKHLLEVPTSSQASEGPRVSRDQGKILPSWTRLKDESPSRDSGYVSQDTPTPTRSNSRDFVIARDSTATKTPHVFFVERSQHFSQSDFGVLFPFLARRFTKAEEPERILELNTRAMVEVLREAGIEVAGKSDTEILDVDGGIRRWKPVSLELQKASALCQAN